MTLGPLLIGIYVFVLAGFVGFEMITKVPPTLHTPLMSGANAISVEPTNVHAPKPAIVGVLEACQFRPWPDCTALIGL